MATEAVFLGKIKRAVMGLGGYQDMQFGLHLELGNKDWGTNVSVLGAWDPARMECSEHAKWTEDDRSTGLVHLGRKTSQLLKEANVRYVHELEGLPVEVTFKDNLLSDWRILKEVL